MNFTLLKSIIFIGRTDVEAEIWILWPPDVKSWLTGKDPDAGRDWRQEEKGMTEEEMVGWHYGFNRHEFGWTLGVGDGQGGLACWGSWGRKESDTTERLNWTELLSAICKPSSDNHFAFLYSFFLGIVLIPVSCTMSETSIHSSSGTLSIRSNPFESISHFHCIIVRDLI